MRTSQNGINLIKQFEGCHLTVYLDPVGIPTVGYGHTAGISKSMVGIKVTQMQADSWLKEDLQTSERKVKVYDAKYKWSQEEFDALVSFAYNIGSIDGLTAKGTRSRAEIADAMLLYNKACGRVLSGLTKRRQAERNMFLGKKTYPVLKRGASGNAVKEMQGYLGIKQDGIFGTITETSVRLFQRQHGLVEDGICGAKTWSMLIK